MNSHLVSAWWCSLCTVWKSKRSATRQFFFLAKLSVQSFESTAIIERRLPRRNLMTYFFFQSVSNWLYYRFVRNGGFLCLSEVFGLKNLGDNSGLAQFLSTCSTRWTKNIFTVSHETNKSRTRAETHRLQRTIAGDSRTSGLYRVVQIGLKHIGLPHGLRR